MSSARASGRGWPIAVGVILGATVALNVWVMRLASADPSFAVEPDYYRRAVHWDDEMAQRRRNAELGWMLEPALAAAPAGGTVLRVRLVDRRGAPVAGATVTVRAFAVARAADVVQATLPDAGAGDYASPSMTMRPGRWELRFEATRGAERFTAVRRVDAGRVDAGRVDAGRVAPAPRGG